jgi:hypothetical protein
MNKYYALKQKFEGAIRPVLPDKFVLCDGILTWDDMFAVYNSGMIEFSKDGEDWDTLCTIRPNVEKYEALVGKLLYRMRVYYNLKWSNYLLAEEKKKPKEESKEEFKAAEEKPKAEKTKKKKDNGKEEVFI